jgi:hypothetical protein
MVRHVDPLLGHDREIGNYTTAVTRQRPVNIHKGKMFSMTRCYKQDKLGVSWLVGQ